MPAPCSSGCSLAASYSPGLVALSVLLAALASYVALDLAGRTATAAGRARLAWLTGGSLAMGFGIWSMHFVGMLAFHLQAGGGAAPVPVAYDLPLVFASVAVAVAASALALTAVVRGPLGPLALAGAGARLGAAIAGMHYVGMWAMRMPARLAWRPALVAASLVVAVAAATAAVWLLTRLANARSAAERRARGGAAALMGFAIAGMHYTGMAAARFSAPAAGPAAGWLPPPADGVLASGGLAAAVAAGALVILGAAVVAAALDRRHRRELARSRDALRASEARFRAALDASLDGFLVFEAVRLPGRPGGDVVDFAVAECNARGARLFGAPRDALLGARLLERLPQVRGSAAFARWVAVAETGAPWEGEFAVGDWAPPSAGAAEWLWLQVVPLGEGTAAGRGAPGVAVTARDITAQKRAERETRLLHEVTRLLGAAPDADGALRAALEAMCRAGDLAYGEAWVPASAPGAPGADAAAPLVRGPAWYADDDRRLMAFDAASRGLRFAPGEGLPGSAAAAGAPVWLADVTAPGVNFRRTAEAAAAGVRSSFAVPVFADGVLTAVLAFHSRQVACADAARLDLLAAVAAQVGAALRRQFAEAALARERAFLAAVLDSLSEGVLACDTEGRPTLFNRAMRELHGLPAEGEVPAERWADQAVVYRPDGAGPLAEAERPLARALAARADAGDVELVVAPPGLPRRTVVANARAIRGPGGAFLGAVAAVRDVTAQKVVEAALGAREARLSLIYDSASDLMFLMRVGERDAAGRAAYTCESVNATYQAATGMEPGQLLGAELDDIVPAHAAARVRGRYDQAVRAGETLRYEEEVELPTGRLTVETTLTPVLDDAGRCTHLLGAARDVTARQRAEAAVRENEARFRGVLENLRAPAVCLDAEGRVTFANDALLALTGWARAEVEGDDYFARFVPGGHEARAVFLKTVAAGRADELPARYENEVLTRDGARRLIAWDNAVLRDADGRVVGTASVGQDVTERARAQRLKDQLIATASHELRTPLTAIRGALDLLDGLRPAAGREPREQVLLGMARRNVLRLTRLVNDVLDVDRLEAGQSPLRRAPADVAALLAAAREGVQGVADEAGVRLDVRLAAPGAARLAVDADADRVVQVLTNLVANAVKFSPPGSAITLAAAADPGGAAGAGEGWVRVTVRDEGRGIPADRLEAVFDRFVQVEEADARERGGAGLGLAICRAIVAQHGGRIWAESAGAGRGSAFHFTLPAAPAAAPAAHAAAA